MLNQMEVEATDIDGASVTVCGAAASCNADGACEFETEAPGCRSDDDCTPGQPVCNTETGACECTADSCAENGDSAFSVCLDSGACGCNDDQQCTDSEIAPGDVCGSNGFCGCSGDEVCEGLTPTYDGTSYACTAL